MSEFCEAYSLLIELAENEGALPLSQHKGCWEKEIGPFWIALNGQEETVQCSRGQFVPVLECWVEYVGWPFCMMGPFNGIVVEAYEDPATEEGLINAIKEEIAQPGAYRKRQEEDRKKTFGKTKKRDREQGGEVQSSASRREARPNVESSIQLQKSLFPK